MIKVRSSCAVPSVSLVLFNCAPFAWPHQPTFPTKQYKQMSENLIRTPFLVTMFYVLFLHGQTLVTVNLRSSNWTNKFRIPTTPHPLKKKHISNKTLHVSRRDLQKLLLFHLYFCLLRRLHLTASLKHTVQVCLCIALGPLSALSLFL